MGTRDVLAKSWWSMSHRRWSKLARWLAWAVTLFLVYKGFTAVKPASLGVWLLLAAIMLHGSAGIEASLADATEPEVRPTRGLGSE